MKKHVCRNALAKLKEIKTLILAMSFTFSWFNCFLCWLIEKNLDRKLSSGVVLIGISLFLVTPFVVFDPRKINHGIDTTISSVFIHLFCTYFFAKILEVWWIWQVFVIEVFIEIMVVIFIKHCKSI